MITSSEIQMAFELVRLSVGEVVMVHSDLTRIGWVKGAKSREDVLEFYLEAILRAIGPGGTLVVLSCTESYAREKRPFIYEESPSEQGVFSEFIRKKPDAIRSMHPLFSVVALGAKAKLICNQHHSCTGFGYGSPFHKLRELDGRVLCIGVDLLSMTFVHHVEQTYGVPYAYTKEWDTLVSYNGCIANQRYFAFVRYLGSGINYNFTKMQKLLLDRDLATKADLGLGAIYSVSAVDVFNLGVEQLQQNPFFFLEKAPTHEPWKK
jgi:aminoglycoside 3-N-acetyltransferase